MKRFICYVPTQGFVLCTSAGTFSQYVSHPRAASELNSREAWKAWLTGPCAAKAGIILPACVIDASGIEEAP